MKQLKRDSKIVLFITHFFGNPPYAGNEKRLLQLARWFLTQGYGVHVAWKAPPQEVIRVQPTLPEITLHALWPKANSIEAHADEVLSMENKICPDWLVEQAETLEVLLQPDVLIAEYVFMSRCLENSHARVRMIDTHDVFSRRKEKVERHGVKESHYIPPETEAKLLTRGNVLLAIQDREAEYLRKLCPEMDVVNCGVDFKPAQPGPARKRYSAIIVGSDNPANRNGVSAFLKHCWPAVRSRVRSASLLVVGGIGNSIHARTPGVTKMGTVADLSALYASTRIALNPVPAGTGLKIKSIEALAHGLPLVTTRNGCEGLSPAGEGRAYFPASDWEQFAAIATGLMLDNKEFSRAQKESRKFAAREFSAKRTYEDLRVFLDRCLR